MAVRDWRLVAGPITPVAWGTNAAEMTTATSRRFTWVYDGPSSCSFNIPANSQEAMACWELTNDVVLYDEQSTPQFRGRIGGIRETFEPDQTSLEVQAVSYRGILDRRVIIEGDTIAFAQVDQSLIAWTLANSSQTRAGGQLNITRGLGQTTGVKRDRNYELGSTIGDMLTELGNVDNGFDWDISPLLHFDIWYPNRARTSPVVLDWGGMVSQVARTWQSQAFANVVRGQAGIYTPPTGAPVPTTPVIVTKASMATVPEGRWEVNLSWPDVVFQSTLQSHTAGELTRRSQRLGQIEVVLRPGMWEGPSQLFIGDVCQLTTPLRSRNVSFGQMSTRNVLITALTLELSDHGGDPVVSLVVQENDAGLLMAPNPG